MLCGWEGNRRSSIAPAMRLWLRMVYITYGLNCLRKAYETLTYASVGHLLPSTLFMAGSWQLCWCDRMHTVGWWSCFVVQEFQMKMEGLRERREELETKELDLRRSLEKFNTFLTVKHSAGTILINLLPCWLACLLTYLLTYLLAKPATKGFKGLDYWSGPLVSMNPVVQATPKSGQPNKTGWTKEFVNGVDCCNETVAILLTYR